MKYLSIMQYACRFSVTNFTLLLQNIFIFFSNCIINAFYALSALGNMNI